MYRIMIVEDEEHIREGLKILLENALYEVWCVTDFRNVREEIKAVSPDLILLDMNLPGNGGLDICRELRKDSDIPVIFVTGNTAVMDELSCMMQGGDDFITKPYKPPILLARIAAVLKRTAGAGRKDQTVLQCKGVTLDLLGARLDWGGRQAELTKNELKILHCLFQHQDTYVSRKDLVDYLWDNQVFIEDNALSVNITRIRSKLEQIGVKGFIETKRGLGYRI